MSIKGIDLRNHPLQGGLVVSYVNKNMLDVPTVEPDLRVVEAALCFAPLHALLRERPDGHYTAIGGGACLIAGLLAYHGDMLRLPTDSRFEAVAGKLFSELPPKYQNRIEGAVFHFLVIGVNTPDSELADALAILEGAGYR